MVVGGVTGDNYYYLFFLGVLDDDIDRTYGENDYAHYLLEARTLDFVNFYMKTEENGQQIWKLFNGNVRPRTLQDVRGLTVMSHNRYSPYNSFGLIGTVVYINNTYYYFYTDHAPGTNDVHLYYRSATNVTGNNYWSDAYQITSSPLQQGAIVRVAKDRTRAKWVVVYSCYKNEGSIKQDICLQYTQNLNIIGTGGISSLTFYDYFSNGRGVSNNYYLGLNQSINFQQHYLMTDKNGTIAVPSGYGSQGIITWSDISGGAWGADVYRAGWYTR